MIKEDSYYLWTTGQGLYLLLLLLFLGIFVSPLLIEAGLVSEVAIEFVLALVLVAGAVTIPCRPVLRCSLFLLAFLAVLTRLLDKYNHQNFTFAGIDKLFAILTLVAFAVLIIKHFLVGKALIRHRIAAAVAVYLIFGILWARFYETVYLVNPDAFSFEGKPNPFSLIYFSFVTLMTIGYGDIVPVSIAARSLAILEGVVGQLYIVILITSLVSEFSALALKSSKERD